jgi:TRAP-type transport system small permease protein
VKAHARAQDPVRTTGFALGLRWLERTELLIATLLLVALLCIVTVQVGARFLFDAPIFWADELARYCYVWMAFVGGVVVTATRTDVKVNMLDQYLSPRALLGVEVFATLLVAGSCIALVIGSYQWLLGTARPMSAALRMPMIYLYGVVWLSVLLMALHSLLHIVNLLTGRIAPTSADDEITLE